MLFLTKSPPPTLPPSEPEKKITCEKAPESAVVKKETTPPPDKILPPPELDKKLQLPIETNSHGEGRVRWTPIPDAKYYIVKLYDQSNKVVKTWRSSHYVIFLKGIPFDPALNFTEYGFTLSTVNPYDKIGPESIKFGLKAKKISDLIAPTIESITVEE